jgi:hypothetical protein
MKINAEFNTIQKNLSRRNNKRQDVAFGFNSERILKYAKTKAIANNMGITYPEQKRAMTLINAFINKFDPNHSTNDLTVSLGRYKCKDGTIAPLKRVTIFKKNNSIHGDAVDKLFISEHNRIVKNRINISLSNEGEFVPLFDVSPLKKIPSKYLNAIKNEVQKAQQILKDLLAADPNDIKIVKKVR